MFKTVDLALNRFPEIPSPLRETDAPTTARRQIEVNLANLYHHYYLDTYGSVPPDPDPANFEYLRFLTTSSDFRILGDGLGVSPGARRNRSTDLGQAFCRLFLHDYLKITYFAHIGQLLDKPFHDHGLQIKRIMSGDVPDYLCADSSNNAFLAEAKGRYTAISFGTKEFETWRRQFSRVAAEDVASRRVSLKGFIVGTRFATESQKSPMRSRINVEDPKSPGIRAPDSEETRALASRIIAIHYGGIAMKLRQPILAAALLNGFLVPDQILFPVTIWQSAFANLGDKQFVGGYYPTSSGVTPIKLENGRLQLTSNEPFRLDIGAGSFFGVEVGIFKQVVSIAREGLRAAATIDTFEQIEHFYSAVSLLRDGTILSPIEFFSPVSTATL